MILVATRSPQLVLSPDEDHLSPDTLEARADGPIRTMLFPVFSAGQWAVTRTVQLNPVPTRVCL